MVPISQHIKQKPHFVWCLLCGRAICRNTQTASLIVGFFTTIDVQTSTLYLSCWKERNGGKLGENWKFTIRCTTGILSRELFHQGGPSEKGREIREWRAGEKHLSHWRRSENNNIELWKSNESWKNMSKQENGEIQDNGNEKWDWFITRTFQGVFPNYGSCAWNENQLIEAKHRLRRESNQDLSGDPRRYALECSCGSHFQFP